MVRPCILSCPKWILDRSLHKVRSLYGRVTVKKRLQFAYQRLSTAFIPWLSSWWLKVEFRSRTITPWSTEFLFLTSLTLPQPTHLKFRAAVVDKKFQLRAWCYKRAWDHDVPFGGGSNIGENHGGKRRCET